MSRAQRLRLAPNMGHGGMHSYIEFQPGLRVNGPWTYSTSAEFDGFWHPGPSVTHKFHNPPQPEPTEATARLAAGLMSVPKAGAGLHV